ncbi:MAG: glycosyltransferase family 1 protein, partial [Hyphomicrobiaceae bacterium]
MKLAFYAPLKSPNDPTPSGDRQIARHFVQALEMAGHNVEIASELRTYEGAGNQEQQLALMDAGKREAVRFVEDVRAGRQCRPDLWFTYHVYHKAPDWIGSQVASA